jgi:hypothetical protein
MQHKSHDYANPRQGAESSRIGKTLGATASISPFVIVPVYIFGTALLQDELVNGDGRSWQRAALRMAVPTGLATIASLVVSLRALLTAAQSRRAAIFATVVNALALVVIVYGTATA